MCVYDDKYKEDNCVDDWEFTIEALEKNTNMSPLIIDEIWFVFIRKEIQKMITMKRFMVIMMFTKLITKMIIELPTFLKEGNYYSCVRFYFLILLMTNSDVVAFDPCCYYPEWIPNIDRLMILSRGYDTVSTELLIF